MNRRKSSEHWPFPARLSGLVNPVERDILQDEIDAAFHEMGVNAPIPKDNQSAGPRQN
jgi:hypothetical protein